MGRIVKTRRPLIVAIGGSTRSGSSSERALHIALDMASAAGCDVHAVAGPALILPPYDPVTVKNIPAAAAIVDVLRRADQYDRKPQTYSIWESIDVGWTDRDSAEGTLQQALGFLGERVEPRS
jgi:hypothetical protein